MGLGFLNPGRMAGALMGMSRGRKKGGGLQGKFDKQRESMSNSQNDTMIRSGSARMPLSKRFGASSSNISSAKRRIFAPDSNPSADRSMKSAQTELSDMPKKRGLFGRAIAARARAK